MTDKVARTANSKAFVFSLDAFVAFSIALIIIYSLIFFSSVPYGYYSSFMQAHYLAKDALTALSLSKSDVEDISVLDYVALHSPDEFAVREFVGPLIPDQFGYTFESSGDGKAWSKIYDTADYAGDTHKKSYNKLKASVQTVVFEYDSKEGFSENVYGYISCTGALTQCNPATSSYSKDKATMKIVKLTVYT